MSFGRNNIEFKIIIILGTYNVILTSFKGIKKQFPLKKLRKLESKKKVEQKNIFILIMYLGPNIYIFKFFINYNF